MKIGLMEIYHMEKIIVNSFNYINKYLDRYALNPELKDGIDSSIENIEFFIDILRNAKLRKRITNVKTIYKFRDTINFVVDKYTNELDRVKYKMKELIIIGEAK